MDDKKNLKERMKRIMELEREMTTLPSTQNTAWHCKAQGEDSTFMSVSELPLNLFTCKIK